MLHINLSFTETKIIMSLISGIFGLAGYISILNKARNKDIKTHMKKQEECNKKLVELIEKNTEAFSKHNAISEKHLVISDRTLDILINSKK